LTKRASKPTALVRGRVLVSLFLLLQALLLLAAQDSHAGVILWLEGGPTSDGIETTRDHEIEIIQGHKGWLFSSGQQFEEISQATYAVVDDLDKGIRTQIDYRHKKYSIEKPFPSPVDGAGGQPVGVGELKPTGKHRKIAGYSCEEYMGARVSAHFGPLTEVDCVSHDAPGVREYNQFMILLNRLYEDAGYSDGSLGGAYPGIWSPQGIDDIPLETDPPGARVGYVVKRIESREIPASQFEVPAGFVPDEAGE
jgi:hypothetical protein